MIRSFPRWPLWASLLLYFALAAGLIAVVPPGATPDEAAHWQYVEHLAQLGTLPVFRGAAPPAPGYEFHQPPLYYLLCAPGWKVLGAGAQNYACRAVSLACGLLTIALIWGAARLVWPHERRIAASAAFLAALWPLHLGVGASSNNDALAGLVSAALFFVAARALKRGASWPDIWQTGALGGAAILSKTTCLPVAFVAFCALAVATRRASSVRVLPALGTALALALLVGGAWLARNQNLYGDPLALGAFGRAADAIGPGYPDFAPLGMSFAAYARGLLWILTLTAWGFFGGPNAAVAATGPLNAAGPHAPGWMLLPLLICGLAPVAAALGWRNAARHNEDKAETRAIAALWALGALLVIAAWAQFAFEHFAGAQARYLHGALLPFCVLGAAGWRAFWGEGRAWWIASLSLGATLLALTLLNVLVWKTLV